MKRLVEDCLAFDCKDLKAGAFQTALGTRCNCIWRDAAGQELLRVNFSLDETPRGPSLRITYKLTSTSVPMSSRIELALVPCHLGGMKYLFRCRGNAVSCAQRVRKLYL